MLDIVCCLLCEHDIDSLRFCLLGLFFCPEDEPGLATCILPSSRVSGWPTHQPPSPDGTQKQHMWDVCPWNSLVSLKRQRKSVPNAEGREGLGDGLVIAPRGDVLVRTEPGTARHTQRSGRVPVLISPQVSAIPPAFCKFAYRATFIFHLALKASERQDNR